MLPIAALPEFARELADCGFNAQIQTATGELANDLALAASLRDVLGTRPELRFDAQNRYRFDDARRLAEGLAEHQVAMLLDPLVSREADNLARFARQSEVAVAVGSSLHSPHDVLQLVREEGVRTVVLTLEKLGGLSAVRDCAAVAAAAGLTAALGGRPTLGLGTAARLQLAAALPTLEIGSECAVHDLRDDILTAPLVPTDGMLTVPDEPGLGVSVDRAQLERWQVT
jgi:L-alanine-DL-glutamate epimerase-like enolase superfamily enzyme